MERKSKFKIGDRVRVVACTAGIPHDYEIGHIGEVKHVYEDGSGYSLGEWACRDDELEPAATSPIRTVTRREIVPGVYGAAEVDDEFVRTTVWLYGDTAADKLREAAHLFNQLAEVLEENAAADKKEAA